MPNKWVYFDRKVGIISCPKEGVAILLPIFIFCLLVGTSAAWAAREQNKQSASLWKKPYLAGVALYTGLVIVPLMLYLLCFHPTWTMFYLFEPNSISGSVILTMILGCLVLSFVGYAACYVLCRLHFDKWPLVLSFLLGLSLLASVVFSGDRFWRVSEGLAFPQAPLVLGTTLGAVFSFAIPLVLGGWIFLLVFYHIEGLKMRRARGPLYASNRISHPLPVASDVPAGSLLSGGSIEIVMTPEPGQSTERAPSPPAQKSLEQPSVAPASTEGQPAVKT
jgi:hypothetical protein